MLHSIREIRGSKRAISCCYHLSYTNKIFIVCLRNLSPFFFLLGNVIVYGNTIDIYTTIETLLSLGIDGSRIHLVQAPLSSASPCLADAALERTVGEALSEAGVAVHPDSVLAQWGQGDHGCIAWAAFTTAANPLRLQCSVSARFLCLSFRQVFFNTKAIKFTCSLTDSSISSLSLGE